MIIVTYVENNFFVHFFDIKEITFSLWALLRAFLVTAGVVLHHCGGPKPFCGALPHFTMHALPNGSVGPILNTFKMTTRIVFC